MSALIVMMVRTKTPAALIPRTFGQAKINIPKAPALGLLLEQVFLCYFLLSQNLTLINLLLF